MTGNVVLVGIPLFGSISDGYAAVAVLMLTRELKNTCTGTGILRLPDANLSHYRDMGLRSVEARQTGCARVDRGQQTLQQAHLLHMKLAYLLSISKMKWSKNGTKTETPSTCTSVDLQHNNIMLKVYGFSRWCMCGTE